MIVPFEVTGMEGTIARIKALAEGNEEAAKRAVKAGAKVLVKRLKEKAPVDTGALRNSIKPDAVQYSAADGYYCEVKPVGNHPRSGESLAKIGNVLEYGRGYGKTAKAGLGWFNPTVKAAEAEVLNAMKAELEKGMK